VIGPIRVPMRIHPQMNPRDHRVTGFRRLGGQDQIHLRMGRRGVKSDGRETQRQEVQFETHKDKMAENGKR